MVMLILSICSATPCTSGIEEAVAKPAVKAKIVMMSIYFRIRNPLIFGAKVKKTSETSKFSGEKMVDLGYFAPKEM
jgi:ribosome biogenesis protein Nip4